MTRDPFLRLALIACTTAYFVGIAVVARFLGAGAAFFATALGIIGAFALTLAIEGDLPKPDPRRRHRQPAEGTKGFERVG